MVAKRHCAIENIEETNGKKRLFRPFAQKKPRLAGRG
jgi:hypothetical protein